MSRWGYKHEADGEAKVGAFVAAELVELAVLVVAPVAKTEGGEAFVRLVGSGAKGY